MYICGLSAPILHVSAVKKDCDMNIGICYSSLYIICFVVSVQFLARFLGCPLCTLLFTNMDEIILCIYIVFILCYVMWDE